MKVIERSKATRTLAEYSADTPSEPLVVTQRGKLVAVLVPVEDTDMESIAVSLNPKFLAIIERSRAQCAAGQGISSEEMRRQLGVPKTPARKRKQSKK
jgi:prevent-host-death family protein